VSLIDWKCGRDIGNGCSRGVVRWIGEAVRE